jgi:cytosine/adenosine deaminase-related metal-dependent hydrolase
MTATQAPAGQPTAADLLLRTSSTIYLDHGREIGNGWIAVTDGRVSGHGTSFDTPPPAARMIDAGHRVVTPGLINTHHHIFQNLGRSYRPVVNAPLFTWSSTLTDMWARLTYDDVRVSAYVGMAELLLGGCTTSTDDLYVHPQPNLLDAEIAAARQIGFRFYPARTGMNRSRRDGYIPSDLVVQPTEVIVADYERAITTYHDPNPGALLRIALSPTTPWSGDDELVGKTVEIAAAHGVRLHTHLSEDEDEYTFCMTTYGCSPVEYFVRRGMATSRTWVAHFAYATDEEAEQLAALGVSAAHCPSSNMMICGQTARVAFLRSIGMPVGLGCDGSASTDHASLWLEARTALLLARFRGGPGAMSARDVLDVATRGSAQCLGWADEIGHLNVGALADIVVWDMDEVSLAGAHTDPVEALLRCGPARAWYTLVGGTPLVAEGALQLPDLPEMLAEHAESARRIQGLTG